MSRLLKMKYAQSIKANELESEKLVKNIHFLNEEKEHLIKHYFIKENELMEYIAKFSVSNICKHVKMKQNLVEIENIISKYLDSFQKKRLKILDGKRRALEQLVYEYQIKENSRRDEIINDKIGMDFLTFQKMEENMKAAESVIPDLKNLEKYCGKLNLINDKLRRKYEILKFENKHLIVLLEKLNSKMNKYNRIIVNRNSNKQNLSLMNNKSNIKLNKSYKNYSEGKKVLNVSIINKKIPNLNRNSANKKKLLKENFVKRINSAYISYTYTNKFNKIKMRRSSSVDKYKINPLKNITNEKIDNIIRFLHKKIDDNREQFQKKIVLFATEFNLNKNIRELISKGVEDLNLEYQDTKNSYIHKKKEEKEAIMEDINKKNNQVHEIVANVRNLEQKIYTLSYIFDNCLKNGENKDLKKHYRMIKAK